MLFNEEEYVSIINIQLI